MTPGYSESDGLIVLAMSRDDYNHLLIALGFATGCATLPETQNSLVRLTNRLNAGNPHFTPYRVPDADPR